MEISSCKPYWKQVVLFTEKTGIRRQKCSVSYFLGFISEKLFSEIKLKDAHLYEVIFDVSVSVHESFIKLTNIYFYILQVGTLHWIKVSNLIFRGSTTLWSHHSKVLILTTSPFWFWLPYCAIKFLKWFLLSLKDV